MGDRICNEDASMFGGLAQVVNHDRGPFNTFLMSKINFFFRRLDNLYFLKIL